MIGVIFNTQIGLGSVLAFVGILGSVIILYVKAAQADPSDWRDNYLAEVTRREEVEKQIAEQRELKHNALNELAALKARTDLQPLLVAVNGVVAELKVFGAQMEQVTATQHETARVLALVAEKLDHFN